MKLSLDALLVLDAIDRQGSFAAAAEELHRVPSAITYTMQKLESDLGVAVFDRGGHRARLTEAGVELLREGRRLLEAAGELELRVRRVATGYEPELRIAVSDLIPIAWLYPVVEEFYEQDCGTRIRISMEAFGGVWDALLDDRADLAIGATGEGPPGGVCRWQPGGKMTFQFVVASTHPLADAPEPLDDEVISAHRAVAVADSSRRLAPRTAGLLTGQDVLTVPDLDSKTAAHIAGLGVGYLPAWRAREEADAGRLRIKQVANPKPDVDWGIAWKAAREGKSLQWFIRRLKTRDWAAAITGGADGVSE